jgi:hypothetical protein
MRKNKLLSILYIGFEEKATGISHDRQADLSILYIGFRRRRKIRA